MSDPDAPREQCPTCGRSMIEAFAEPTSRNESRQHVERLIKQGAPPSVGSRCPDCWLGLDAAGARRIAASLTREVSVVDREEHAMATSEFIEYSQVQAIIRVSHVMGKDELIVNVENEEPRVLLSIHDDEEETGRFLAYSPQLQQLFDWLKSKGIVS